ncbi:MAG: phosphatidylglycerol lysyltransferase domain-containing protein [Elusimicrobiaceae bacterium]|nr:phosphatidylglycerol lysyltransferase domain-containing protein [Elusimicrobiaceae bacterium]
MSFSFVPLSPSDGTLLSGYFAGQKYRLSSYSPGVVSVWNNCAYSNFFAETPHGLLISEQSVTEPDARWLLLPVGGAEPAPPALAALARSAGIGRYRFVPGGYLERVPAAELEKFFIATRERNCDDYIYRRADLADLSGHRYSKKRNLIRQFEREYLAAGRVSVEPITEPALGDCREFAGEWYRAKSEKFSLWPQDMGCERKAFFQTLANFSVIGVRGIAVRIDGRVRALAIGTGLTADTGVLNFEKAAGDFKGLYQFLDREAARRIFEGYDYISKENDMGDEGLRQAKLSYHPAHIEQSWALDLR